ncbi:8120_t:CDS:1, partial [Funneliformis mosseae]
MSDIKESIDWFEEKIDEGYFNYYEYLDFKNIQPIGNGSFGNVMRANWK